MPLLKSNLAKDACCSSSNSSILKLGLNTSCAFFKLTTAPFINSSADALHSITTRLACVDPASLSEAPTENVGADSFCSSSCCGTLTLLTFDIFII